MVEDSACRKALSQLKKLKSWKIRFFNENLSQMIFEFRVRPQLTYGHLNHYYQNNTIQQMYGKCPST